MRIIMVKITDPKPCIQCERIIQIGEWAQAHGSTGFSCATCGAGNA